MYFLMYFHLAFKKKRQINKQKVKSFNPKETRAFGDTNCISNRKERRKQFSDGSYSVNCLKEFFCHSMIFLCFDLQFMVMPNLPQRSPDVQHSFLVNRQAYYFFNSWAPPGPSLSMTIWLLFQSRIES